MDGKGRPRTLLTAIAVILLAVTIVVLAALGTMSGDNDAAIFVSSGQAQTNVPSRTPAPTVYSTEVPYPAPVTATRVPEFIPNRTSTPNPTTLAMSNEDYVDWWIDKIEAENAQDPRAAFFFEGPFQLVDVATVYSNQMPEVLNVDPLRISVPDIAFVLNGHFRALGDHTETPWRDYALFVTDRSSGYVLYKELSDSASALTNMLPDH